MELNYFKDKLFDIETDEKAILLPLVQQTEAFLKLNMEKHVHR